MNKIRQIIIVCIGFFMFFSSCNSIREDQKRAKAFQYSIKYLVSPDENPVVSLLPDRMDVYYVDNYIYYSTEGWMGLFSSAQILNIKDSTRTLLSKFLDKKYAHIQSFDDIPLKFEKTKHFNFQGAIKDTVFKSYRAKSQWVVYEDSTMPINVIYTNNFGIKNPNIGGPLKSIDGILLQFPMQMMEIPMIVELVNSKDTVLNDSLFLIPNSYLVVDREQIEKIFDEFAPK